MNKKTNVIQTESNARLIAAAPDLLKALTDLIQAYRLIGDTNDHAYRQARAAALKATGGAE